MFIINNLYFVVLGEIAKTYNNEVSINLFNAYLRNYKIDEVDASEFDKIMNAVWNDEEARNIYYKAKTGKVTASEYLGYADHEDDFISINTEDGEIKYPKDEFNHLVDIVEELQLATPSHKIPWNKVKKHAESAGLVFYKDKEFKRLLTNTLDAKRQAPVIKNSPKTRDFLNRTFGDELGELQLQKRAVQNDKRIANKIQRELSDQALFRRTILDTVAKPRTLKEYKVKPFQYDPEYNDLVVVTSDWHIGAVVDLKHNQYNPLIAEYRMQNYLNHIGRQIEINKPRKIYIINLGDLIENVQMRAVNQSYYTDMTLSEQIIKASAMQSEFVRSIAKRYPDIPIEFSEITGNHDRYAPNKQNALYGDSVGMVARALTDRDTRDLDNVTVVEPVTEYRTLIESSFGKVGFVHGDLDNINQKGALANYNQFMHTDAMALVGGHLHSLAITENSGYQIQSGSLIGATEYSDRLGCYAKPSQVMLRLDDHGITPIIVNL